MSVNICIFVPISFITFSMTMTKSENTLLALVRIAVNGTREVATTDFTGVDWSEVLSLSLRQTVVGLAFDALERLPESCRPKREFVLKWCGYVAMIERAYARHRKVIFSLADFYAANGFRMMLLKGCGLSLDWPVPNHRPTGDMDIFLGSSDSNGEPSFGITPEWQEADKVLGQKLGIRVDNSHHHHSVFAYKGITVENHYDFINRYSRRSSRSFEKVLKSLASEKFRVHAECPNLYFPSDDFNALFLLKHCASHFESTQMTLRQTLDWLLFVRGHHDSIDRERSYSYLHEYGLERFADILSAIGVDYLGMPADIFYSVEQDKSLVERVLSDIFSPEFKKRENGTLASRLWVKLRRFWHNRWKRRLCGNDSLLSTFLWSTFAKLLKPSHFKD